jgi:Flp pilus assembly protein TadG
MQATDKTVSMAQRFGRGQRRGVALVYTVILMTLFCAICTLAVDYGRVQLIKSEMQRTADATARAYITYYMNSGKTYADSHIATIYAQAQNPVDSNSGTNPTVTVTFGSWNSGTSTFSASTGTTPAVKVTVTRTAANSNAVPITWGGMLGKSSIDVHASAVAALMGGQSTSTTLASTSDLYFSGMPNNTTDSYGDNFANNAPTQISSIPVTPGTYIKFTNTSGTSSVVPGSVPYSGPDGASGYVVEHGQNWDGTEINPGSDNGIADATMPEDAVVGLFLTNNAPNLSSAPSGNINWTQAPYANQATYTNLQVQAPFMIGNGQTTGGTVQQFLVPAGATRLFMGIWDGVDYNNNGGSITGTVAVQNYVAIVQ